MSPIENCDRLAVLLKALGHPTRLRIVRLLSGGVSCVDDIRMELNLKQPNISQHLAILRGAEIVTFQREGNRVCYRLTNPDLPISIALLGTCIGVRPYDYPEMAQALNNVRQKVSDKLRGQDGS